MEDSEGYDSDAVLQELFAAGKLKPGLNIPVEKKTYVNNVPELNKRLVEISNNLQWIERLDITNEEAPVAPELSMEITEQEQLLKAGRTSSVALNEFKRETMFHRQAQAAAIEGISRLKSQGVSTIRPDDYFAEMMKTDEHMQKVRQSILQKQAGLERSEKVKKIREEKKLAKKKQVESTLKKQKEKKEFSEEIKKFRKGFRKDLDFLEDKPIRGPNKQNNFKDGRDESFSKKGNKKRKAKDDKFGFGGRKRGKKTNDFTKERGKGGKGGKDFRPGKNRRLRMKKR